MAIKRPLGDPYPILHLHSASLGMYLLKPNDRLVLNLAKEKASLWITL